MNRKKIIALTIAASISAFTDLALAEYHEVMNSTYELSENKEELSEVVSIKDVELKKEIMKALDTTDETITVRDMYELKNLYISRSLITSLEGLEHAKNLESIEINHSEITDISPLKNLNNLKDLSIKEGQIVLGLAPDRDDMIVIDESRIDITGERIIPLEVRIGTIEGVKKLKVEELVLEDGTIEIEKNKVNDGVNSLTIVYEGAEGGFQTQSRYMFIK